MNIQDTINAYKILETLPEGDLKTSLQEVISYADSCYVSEAEEMATAVITNVSEIQDTVIEAATSVFKDFVQCLVQPGMADAMSDEFRTKVEAAITEHTVTVRS